MSSQHSGTIGLTPAMVANIRATMMNVEGFKVNWAGVKQATGVSSNGNAAQGFRNAMKAFGLKVVDAKSWTFADENDEPAAGTTVPPTPGKKRGRPKKDQSPDAKRQKAKAPQKEIEDADGDAKQDANADKEVVDEAKVTTDAVEKGDN